MHDKWQDEFRDTVPVGRVLTAVAVLIVLSLLGSRFFVSFTPTDMPKVSQGVIDVGNWDFRRGTVDLGGEWEFYWEQYLGENKQRESVTPEHYADLTALWSNLNDEYGEPIAARWGFATYRTKIQNLPPGKYALSLPIIYAPSRIWIDGELRSQIGTLARKGENERAVWKGHYLNFVSTGNNIEVVLEVSDHIRGDGRILETPVLGPTEAVHDFQILYTARDLILQGIATVLFIFALVLFIFRREDRASLFFSLFCLLFGTTLSFRGINISEIVLPEVDFWTKLTVFYLAEIGSFVTFVLYVAALYPREAIRPINYLIYLACTGVAVHTFVSLSAKPVPIDLSVFGPFLQSMVLVLAYTLFIAARASLRKREGALIFLIGLAVLLWYVLAELLITLGILPEVPALGIGVGMMSLGFLVFLIAQIIILAQRWTQTLHASERMTTDLSHLIEVSSAISSEINLETLLRRIVNVTTDFIHADRSTLYLYDEKTDELWSLIAEGIENREIRFLADEGIAGACFQTGDTINVDDAYSDPRFNAAFDTANNYKTKTLLTMPVETKNGKRIGVMQVLNKTDGSFTPIDEQRLRAFAAQIAISIENAELFGDVIAARNYNDRILSSMSNGVITLNPDNSIAKLNDAAMSIFDIDDQSSEPERLSDIIDSGTDWMSGEIELVRAEGKPRIVLDGDIKLKSGSVKAANLSIVPLLGIDGNEIGTLVLVDDISGEKRLRGTMSRFLTKEVADQVLEQGTDTLAGASANASVVFADLRNFTTITEKLGPKETVSLLNTFFGGMTDAIFKWQGILDKFIGDSVMAVFGVPIEGNRDPDNAVASAVDMMRNLGAINARRRETGKPELALSIGIATGEVVAGTIGSAKRMDYTVIGDSVNLAARLESITRYYGVSVIASEETVTHCAEPITIRELDLIRVNGRRKPTAVFEILDHYDEASFPNMSETLQHYQQGFSAFRNRDWKKAAAAFRAALTENPSDAPSMLYLERSNLFSKSPPPTDWDGVWEMHSK